MPKPSPQKPAAKKHLYLTKANDDLVCHCACDKALITFPPQMDCPWCGCGWLFCCATCRKAFTFAVAVEVNESWEETALRDLKNRGEDFEEPTADDVAMWVEAMKEMCQDLEIGSEYVYFDGMIIPTDFDGIESEGYHSNHMLAFVPQVQALEDKAVLTELLGNQNYWTENQVPPDEEDDEHGEYEDNGELDDEDEEDDEDRR